MDSNTIQPFSLKGSNLDTIITPHDISKASAIETIPIDALREEVGRLQKSWQEALNFVTEQEEEVAEQLKIINYLKEKLDHVQDNRRSEVLNQLVEEQERYCCLEQTLVGQRRNLVILEHSLTEHQQVLWKREEEHKNMKKARTQRKLPRKVTRQKRQSSSIPSSWLYGFGFLVVLYFVVPHTLFGLPPSLIFSALQDAQVRESLFSGDSTRLRNRLKTIGLEDKANTYFEEQIPDDRAREHYLDQQFRDVTGYYNQSEYEEGEDGRLDIKK